MKTIQKLRVHDKMQTFVIATTLDGPWPNKKDKMMKILLKPLIIFKRAGIKILTL